MSTRARASTAAAFEGNARCLSELRDRVPKARGCSRGCRRCGSVRWTRSTCCWWIVASPGFRLPKRQGVGLARRIGCDLAAALKARGAFSGELIACTDADAVLPDDYFSASRRRGRGHGASALLFPFQHELSGVESIDVATRSTSCPALLRARFGLGGSPYAFQTLGSSIALDFDAYAKVRGFPRRRAGEDFYVLCKLAKVAPILRELAATRFGSAHAVRHAFRSAPARASRNSRDANCCLRAAELCRVARLAALFGRRLRMSATSDARARACRSRRAASARSWMQCSPPVMPNARCTKRAGKPRAGRTIRRLHTWFDGFRTLKLIHGCAKTLARRALARGARSAEFLAPVRLGTGDPFSQCRALEKLEAAAKSLVGPTLSPLDPSTP